MLRIFTRPVIVEYRTRILSRTTVVITLLTTLHYLLPLYLVWNSDGFWIKESHFREMPSVEFARKMIILLETNDSRVEGGNRKFGYSTLASINAGLEREDNLLPVQIQDHEQDIDLDHRLDRLKLELTFPLDLRYNRIQSIELILVFSYRLSDRIDLRMQSLGHARFAVQHRLTSGLSIVADLNLIQYAPFYHRGYDYTYNHSILDDHHPVMIQDMLAQYFQRDYYTSLHPVYTEWHPYYQTGSESFFHLSLTLAYREQSFGYTTGFWYLVKWALVQYFVLWSLVAILVASLKCYIFDEALLPSVPVICNIHVLKQILDKKR